MARINGREWINESSSPSPFNLSLMAMLLQIIGSLGTLIMAHIKHPRFTDNKQILSPLPHNNEAYKDQTLAMYGLFGIMKTRVYFWKL